MNFIKHTIPSSDILNSDSNIFDVIDKNSWI